MPMKTDHQQLITHVHIDTLEVCIICRAGRARWTVVIIATAEVLLNLLLLLIVIANHFGFFWGFLLAVPVSVLLLFLILVTTPVSAFFFFGPVFWWTPGFGALSGSATTVSRSLACFSSSASAAWLSTTPTTPPTGAPGVPLRRTWSTFRGSRAPLWTLWPSFRAPGRTPCRAPPGSFQLTFGTRRRFSPWALRLLGASWPAPCFTWWPFLWFNRISNSISDTFC